MVFRPILSIMEVDMVKLGVSLDSSLQILQENLLLKLLELKLLEKLMFFAFLKMSLASFQ
ncbi:MAG: hypothetical protein QG594_1177 [Bacteroidota bacterium]|nr:hypothetical protein [Bacteroidota bacterium]